MLLCLLLMKTEIAKILLEEGYINSFEVSDGENINGILKIHLIYSKEKPVLLKVLKESASQGLEFMQKKKRFPEY